MSSCVFYFETIHLLFCYRIYSPPFLKYIEPALPTVSSYGDFQIRIPLPKLVKGRHRARRRIDLMPLHPRR